MSKRKCKTGIFLLIILLISALFPPIETQNVYAEESGPKQLQELEQGEEIIFASAEWIVLEPSEGYILRKESIGNRQFDNGTSLSNRFDPSDASNLAHYLNGDYYDEAFTSAEQAVIEERIWGIGDEHDENADQVNANIGLLSYEEWRAYSKSYNSSDGFLDDPASRMWLRTPTSSTDGAVWTAWYGSPMGALVYNLSLAMHPVLTLKSDIAVSDDNEVILPPKQLQDLEQGEEITFAGTEWIVLEPDEGYVLRKESIRNRQFNTNWWLESSNRFDPWKQYNLAHYLNVDYYNEAFTSAEQSAIEPRDWGIGDETDENADQVNTNIGLLSYGEWEEYSKFYNSSNGFLDNPEREMWLRTPSSSRNTDVWYVGQTGILGACHVSVCNFAVRPALTLKSDIFVLDEKELIVADITFDPNGTGDTWTQEHETTVTVNKFVKASDVQYTWSTETTKPNEEEDWKALEVNEEGRAKSIKTPEKATGEYYLHMQGKDITDRDFHIHSKVFKIDNRNPTAPSIDTPTEWTNVPTVKITAGEDEDSGVDDTKYRLQGNDDEEWGEWQTLDETGKVKIEAEGETMIQARTIDRAGNQSEVTEVTVKIDQTKPDIAFNPNGNNKVAKEGSTKVTVTDEGSGVDEDSLFYIWSQSETSPDEEAEWSAFTNGEKLTKTRADGDWYLHIQATDRAGNQAYAVTNVFVLDNTPPEAPEIHPDTADWTNNDVTVRIEGEEEDATIQYQLNGTEDEAWREYKEELVITEEGETTIYARAIDEVGNISDIADVTVKIDRSNPEITIDMTQGNDGTAYENDTWTHQAVHLSLKVTDQAIKDWTIKVNGEIVADVNNFTHAFSITKAGTHSLTVTAADKAGNQAEETRTIRIDQTPPSKPVIQLSAEGWTNAEVVTATIIAGEDQESGVDQTQYRIGEGEWAAYDQPLSIDEAGETKIEARTIDQAGNISDIAEVIVKIKRNIPAKPVIHVETSDWTNAEMVSVELTTDEAGGTLEYQLNDTEEGWLTYTEGMAISEEGITKIYARVVDQAGNVSEVAEAMVKIDRHAPTLTLLGDNPMYVGYKEIFEDPGYEVEDNFTEDVTVKVTGEVNTSQVDVYELTYKVQDMAGNETSKTRSVHVVYEESPIILLDGENPLILEVGTAYEEPGATATDQAGNDISEQMKITDTIDTSKLGSYQVTYEVEDDSGNKSKATRNVEVVDTTAPEITLNGEAEITLELGDSYQEAGAVASDNYDGNLNEAIRITGDVLTNKTGTYHVTYTVTDSSNNVASVTRTVYVIDTTAPNDVTLEITEVTTEKITFIFSAQDAGGIKEYILSRNGIEITRINGEATTYTDQTVEAGTTYLYKLEAIDPSGNAASATVEITTKEAEPTQGAPIEVNYVDETGKAVAEPEKLTGNLGEAYKTEPKIITGYQLIETPENATGTFTEEAQTVIYVYALIEEEPTQGAPIEVNYVDETGKAVAEPEKLTGNLGEAYKTEPKVITGYQLIETPENATGKFTEEAQTVTYVYAPIEEEPTQGAPIEVNYVDETGKAVAEPEKLTG
ncbi:OmpL47-type beta-barrel domain-containing protein, partial [Gracilibacillus alcaliphilus]|uniref:OmpL47-type beta-barrel domain-containing protein n=1 Tax=Gracilibacillus alcaliphilus TaxID=1401441 RepID=UPI00195D6627